MANSLLLPVAIDFSCVLTFLRVVLWPRWTWQTFRSNSRQANQPSNQPTACLSVFLSVLELTKVVWGGVWREGRWRDKESPQSTLTFQTDPPNHPPTHSLLLGWGGWGLGNIERKATESSTTRLRNTPSKHHPNNIMLLLLRGKAWRNLQYAHHHHHHFTKTIMSPLTLWAAWRGVRSLCPWRKVEEVANLVFDNCGLTFSSRRDLEFILSLLRTEFFCVRDGVCDVFVQA